MFAKNLLSVIGLLFIGSQIASVSASCATRFDGGLKINGDCTPGYYLTDNSGSAAITSDLSGCNSSACKLKKCDNNDGSTACTNSELTGYIPYGYDGTLLECYNGDCTAASVVIDTNCNDHLGKLITGNLFCQTGESGNSGLDIRVSTETLYLFKIAKDTSSIFTGATNVGADTNVVVKVGNGAVISVIPSELNGKSLLVGDKALTESSGSIVVDTSVTGTDYCLSDATKILTKRDENYCDDETNACDKYYKCNLGESCEDKTTDFTKRQSKCDPTNGNGCGNGVYYIIVTTSQTATTANLLASVGAGDLYKCTINGSTNCVKDEFTIGYLANGDETHASDLPYIQCSATTTSGESGGKTIAKNSCTALSKGDVSSTYKINSSCSSPGQLIYSDSYKICLDDDGTITPAPLATSSSYIVKSDAENTFVKTALENHYVIVNLGDGHAILNREQKKYKYVKMEELKVIEKDSVSNLGTMCTGNPSKLDNNVGHEIEMTSAPSDAASADLVDYYKDNNAQ